LHAHAGADAGEDLEADDGGGGGGGVEGVEEAGADGEEAGGDDEEGPAVCELSQIGTGGKERGKTH
jgi:hypothetical protein